MRLAIFAVLALLGEISVASACIGYKNAFGVERDLFVAGMKAAGFDLKIARECRSGDFLGCKFDISDGSSGAMTITDGCVTNVMAFLNRSDVRHASMLFMVAAATAIAKKDIGDNLSRFAQTVAVAGDAQSLWHEEKQFMLLRYKIWSPSSITVEIESRDLFTEERLQRFLDSMSKDAAMENDAAKKRLMEKLKDGR